MSVGVTDGNVINAFAADPDSPYLVSFPRTGGAWLRMMIELALDRPTLTRVYFLQDRTDYVLLHTHDNDLSLRRRSVIYLYRDPVDTVYSQLSFGGKDLADETVVGECAERYGQHLWKWLVAEDFAKKKTLLRYDRLKENVTDEMRRVGDHLSIYASDERFHAAAVIADKGTMKRNTAFDTKIMRVDEEYEVSRERFKKDFAKLVWRWVLDDREEIERWLR